MTCEGYDVSGEDASGQGASGADDAAGGQGASGADDAAGGQGASGADDAAGPGGDEAVWHDLIARYDLPADPPEATPWPDRESLTPPTGDRARVIRPATSPPGPATASSPAADAGGAGRHDEAGDNAEEHYVPPPPPPLPHLDPIAKGAWVALFGGPIYLLIATLIGWTVSGWAALLAVMAFVGGFAVVVVRLGDGPSRGAGPGNGAVL
jgi:hypothetical protein